MMGSLFSFFVSWGTTAFRPGLHVSASPAKLQLKDSTQLTLQDLIKTRCQSVLREFKPAWWLFNGHLQTAYCVAGDFSKVDEVIYERHLLRVPDGGTLGLDFTAPSQQANLDPETPIVVVMHGLTGGSYESYVRSILSVTCAARDQGGLGYRGVVVNFRGCAGVELTSTQFYSAGYTDDLRIALLYISNLYPRAKLMGLGFSLGANVITRYLGEEGEESKLTSGCVLACPWDLVKNSNGQVVTFSPNDAFLTFRCNSIEEYWFTRVIYSRAMANNLRKMVQRHLPTLVRLGPSILTPHLESLLSARNPRLIDVDERLVRLVGGASPPFPFPTATKYYEWASSHHHVNDIRKPFLAINALDDPIVKHLPLPIPDQASSVAIVATRYGGHLGWFQRKRKAGRWAVERWVRQPVCEWLKAIGDELVIEIKDNKGMEKVDGFTRDIGNPKIGYCEVGEEQVVATAGATGILAGL